MNMAVLPWRGRPRWEHLLLTAYTSPASSTIRTRCGVRVCTVVMVGVAARRFGGAGRWPGSGGERWHRAGMPWPALRRPIGAAFGAADLDACTAALSASATASAALGMHAPGCALLSHLPAELCHQLAAGRRQGGLRGGLLPRSVHLDGGSARGLGRDHGAVCELHFVEDLALKAEYRGDRDSMEDGSAATSCTYRYPDPPARGLAQVKAKSHAALQLLYKRGASTFGEL